MNWKQCPEIRLEGMKETLEGYTKLLVSETQFEPRDLLVLSKRLRYE